VTVTRYNAANKALNVEGEERLDWPGNCACR